MACRAPDELSKQKAMLTGNERMFCAYDNFF